MKQLGLTNVRLSGMKLPIGVDANSGLVHQLWRYLSTNTVEPLSVPLSAYNMSQRKSRHSVNVVMMWSLLCLP